MDAELADHLQRCPEFAPALHDQLGRVRAVAAVLGREDALVTELLLAVLLAAAGCGTSGLLTVRDGRVVIRRQPPALVRALADRFVDAATEPLRASIVARALPRHAARASLAWARSALLAVDKKARELLSLAPRVDGEAEGRLLAPDPCGPREDAEIALAQRLVALANVAKIGGGPSAAERRDLDHMLARSGLPDEARDALRDAFDEPRQHPVDFAAFGSRPASHALVIDLVTFARPEAAHYVRHVAHRVAFPADELEQM